MKAVEIPEGVTAVDDFAFQDCRNLKQVVFPSTLEKIGESAFENCTKLEEATMQEGLTTLQDKAFCNCRSLKSVHLPGSVRHFGKGVFERCENLSQVSGDENVPWQGKGAFIRTPRLQTKAQDSYVLYDGSLELYADTEVEVRVPMAKTICKYAFAENPCIEKVYIHEGTETIEEMAFANCKKLRFIYIPASVTYIAENAFSGNTDFVISCHRGSVASSFRIRNKIPGEYVKKEKEKPATPIERKRSGTASGRSDLSGLSEDEFRMVMEMRRAKLAEKEVRKVEPVQEEKVEYTVASDSAANVSSAGLALCEDSRKITNNIFSLSFQQLAPAENPDEAAEFEIFVIDQNGKIVSDQKVISAG